MLMALQLHPYIKAVVDQYKHKIPKEHLKRFAKEVCQSLSRSTILLLTLSTDSQEARRKRL